MPLRVPELLSRAHKGSSKDGKPQANWVQGGGDSPAPPKVGLFVDRRHIHGARFAIALKVPEVPAVVQTHPGVPPPDGVLFKTTSPLAHVPVVGAAVSYTGVTSLLAGIRS